jgi:uncharacterized protein YlxW (UPF0749 family)
VPDSAYHPLPPRVTLPLLELVTQESLDQDYRYLAERRAQGEPPRSSSRTATVAVLGVLALFGLLVATAAAQDARDAVVDATSRAVLIDQINQRRDQLARSQDRIGRMRARISTLESGLEVTGSSQVAAGQRVQRLLARTGFGAVRGPGVRVVVEDSPSGIPNEAVRDSDLALLVNALWSVGAEAISINEQRLTVLSAIRNVDVAVHVNGKPVSPPYIVSAIGDPKTLQADLVNSPRGQAFFALADALGLVWDMSNQTELILPAAPLRPLRAATITGQVDNGPVGSQKEAPS